MSLQDHLKTCSYCREKYSQLQKPTVRIKSASSYLKERKLASLASIIKGVSCPEISYAGIKKTNPIKSKGASASNPERQFKLKELGKMVRGR